MKRGAAGSVKRRSRADPVASANAMVAYKSSISGEGEPKTQLTLNSRKWKAIVTGAENISYTSNSSALIVSSVAS